MPAAKKKFRWSFCDVVADELPTIEPWIPILANKSCVDPEGIRHLRRVARGYGMEGYKAANSIIGKVVKKTNDDTTLWNPSAWVTGSAKRAEKSLIVFV